MTRNERIRETWNTYGDLVRQMFAEGYRGPFVAILYDPIDDWYFQPSSIPEDTAAETVVFTFQPVGYHHQGIIREWWNVICEGRIIDYFPN